MRASKITSSPAPPPMDWSMLLIDAVSKPGAISEAYRRFWNYSTGNQLLAMFECMRRKITPGPIHTFQGWKKLGRHVKKGEKAMTLCMPVTVKRKANAKSSDVDDRIDAPAASYTRFLYKAHWFVLAQTEGEEYQPADLPEWQEERALSSLDIERIGFEHPNGNCQGFALRRQVAVSPIAFAPHRTLFHELAHVVLGHTDELERMDDDDVTPTNLREVEAECVALICCASLNLGGHEFSRGYIQHWLIGATIPEKSAHRIFRAADQILKAGHPAQGSLDQA
ncbi:MAG: hypothetical protein JWN34_4819 [Bryobacterales bacterium]|nr:hypothetical protein [Bryobacterales bacterium]